MTEKEHNITRKISEELLKRFPDQKPKIAAITEYSFVFELERHNNFTYYVVKYSISDKSELTIDWENAELTVI